MRTTAVLLALAGLAVSVLANCPSNSSPSSDGLKCFHFVPVKADFLGAEQLCKVFGGHLASVANAADNSIIQNGAKKHFKGEGNTLWIGADNLGDFSTWQWTDKSVFGYSNWADVETQQFDHNCASASESNGKWSPTACCDLKPYVCEVLAAVCPTPPPPTCPTITCPECPTHQTCPTQPPTTLPPTTTTVKPTEPTTEPPTIKPPPPGCSPNPCGVNADCSNNNGQVTCVCREGHAGNDPFLGCFMNVSICYGWGDPHYKSCDGTYFDYQGTCPYIFSQPCHLDPADPHYYSIKAKNVPLNGAVVSVADEIEVTMTGQKFHVSKDFRLLVNGIFTNYPYYYPSQDDKKVKVELRANKVFFTNRDNLVVAFSKYRIELKIPQIPQFLGKNAICGVAGNLNNICNDDIVGADGSSFNHSSCTLPRDKASLKEIAKTSPPRLPSAPPSSRL